MFTQLVASQICFRISGTTERYERSLALCIEIAVRYIILSQRPLSRFCVPAARLARTLPQALL